MVKKTLEAHNGLWFNFNHPLIYNHPSVPHNTSFNRAVNVFINASGGRSRLTFLSCILNTHSIYLMGFLFFQLLYWCCLWGDQTTADAPPSRWHIQVWPCPDFYHPLPDTITHYMSHIYCRTCPTRLSKSGHLSPWSLSQQTMKSLYRN